MTDEIIDGEVWKAYPHDPRYLVSNMGRVRGQRGQLLTPQHKPDGYCHISLGRKNRKTLRISRMVLETFDPLNEMEQACHINGVRHDNRLENLRWDTRKGNEKDKLKHDTHTRGQRNGRATLTNAQVVEIKRMLAAGMSNPEVARKIGSTRQVIYHIASGRKWLWINENTLSAEVER